MQIVSYRGPSQAGGVSNLINQAFLQNRISKWWYINDNILHCTVSEKKDLRASILEKIVDGHYRYCNEYLWPIMHDRHDLAQFNAADHKCYKAFNLAIGTHLNWENFQPTYIHDYQFAVLPSCLPEWKWPSCLFFWHIPWPEHCNRESAIYLSEIAIGLLRCARVGFHTKTYVDNFCAFVREFLSDFYVAPDNARILHISGHSTEVVASPAGIDYRFWNHAASVTSSLPGDNCPYILSVDRADYSKGIDERIAAVEILFDRHPELIGKVQFVFACQPTRQGLIQFDNYWRRCQTRYQAVLLKFSTDNWSPILWLNDSLTANELAALYAGATVMLVNPSIDGLNLTAKEYVASCVDGDGVLVLSKGAGAWQEMKDFVVTLPKCQPDEIAKAIAEALRLQPSQKRSNMLALKRVVRANTLEGWWEKMTDRFTSELCLGIDTDCA